MPALSAPPALLAPHAPQPPAQPVQWPVPPEQPTPTQTNSTYVTIKLVTFPNQNSQENQMKMPKHIFSEQMTG